MSNVMVLLLFFLCYCRETLKDLESFGGIMKGPVPDISEEILVQDIEAALVVLSAIVHPWPGGLEYKSQ